MNTQMVELDKELSENKSKREELQQEKVSPPHHTLKGFSVYKYNEINLLK
jgi:hypothetical protein